MKKKYLSILLAALMMLSCITVSLTGCGDNTENDAGTDDASDTQPAEEGTLSPYAALEKENFGGETFTILCRDGQMGSFYVEVYGREGNTLLDDSIYERNEVVSRDLGIVIKAIDGGDNGAIDNAVVTQVHSGTADYDVFTGHKSTFTACAKSGILLDMNGIETMNLSGPWWDQVAVEAFNVGGRVVLTVGDLLPGSMTLTACYAFNKKLTADMGKTEPYDAVRAGKWTMDMLNEMSADVTADLNGDGKITPQDDMYGISAWCMGAPFSLYYATGRRFVENDEDGMPVVAFNEDEFLQIYEKIFRGMITQQANYCTDISLFDLTKKMFCDSRALFMDCSLCDLSIFSASMEDDYGVLPAPKFDEKQEKYYGFVNGASPYLGILGTEKRPEFVGAVLEAMAAYNYTFVSPQMFEITTKYRQTRDPESAEMVDIIIHNRAHDLAYCYDLSLSNLVLNGLGQKSESLGSTIKSALRSSENSLKIIVKKIG